MNKATVNFSFVFLTAIFMLGGSSVDVSGQTCNPAPVGLVSWYPADGNALDSRSRNNGTLGVGSQFAAGQVGQAFQTTSPTGNTVSTIAESANTPSLDFTNAFTIEMWVSLGQVGANNGTSFLVCKGDCGSPGGFPYGLVLNNNGSEVFFRVGNGSTFVSLPSSPLPLNTFTHLAASYESNGTLGTLRIYLNGVLNASMTTTVVTTLGDSSQPLTIGGSTVGNTLGIYDEISLYNRVLSAPEIAAIANAGTAGKCKPSATAAPSGLAGWWAGDGNAIDISGNNNNGTIGASSKISVGKVGQAFQTTTISGVAVSVPDSPTLDFTNAYTIEMWVSPSQPGIGGSSFFACKGNCGAFDSQSYSFVFGANRQAVLRAGNSSTFDSLGSTALLPLNTFSHLVGTYDGSTMRIYIDGVLDSSKVTTIGTLVNSSQPFIIGGSTGSGGAEAIYDEVSLYNRALTDAEITSIFNAGIAGKLKQNAVVDTNSLVSLWQGEGNAADTRGVNNATLLNGAGFAVGRVGQGFLFDGIDDQVVVGNAPSLDVQTGDFTIEAWANAAESKFHFIAGKDSCGEPSIYSLNINQFDAPSFRVNNSAGNSFIVLAAPVSLNAWHHIVGVKEAGNIKIFVDGVLQNTLPISGSFAANANNFSIGNRINSNPTGCGNNNFSGRIDEAAIYNRALTAAEIRADYEAGNALSTVVGDARVTFPTVTTAGTTQQIPLDTSLFPAVPIGTHTRLAYDIATSSVFTGNTTVCFNLPAFTSAQFTDLRVLHFEGGAWINRTAAANIFPSLCTEPLASLSPFAIVQMAPSAAEVSVGGRVVTAAGRGISKTRVTLSDSNGNIRTVMTGTFGYYEFYDVPVGETYTVSVRSKRYQFVDPTRTINVMDELSNVDFTALP